MIIVTTKHITNDERDFCAEWKAIPSFKFDPSKLSINQYAYPDDEIPDDFYKKHPIYYVDHTLDNKLIKAYELEDKWDDMQFIQDSTIGTGGSISDDALINFISKQVSDLALRVNQIELKLQKYDFDQMIKDIEKLKQDAILVSDTVNINQPKN